MSQRSIIEPYSSPYQEQRKQEYDSMEFERLQRQCWVNILSHNITDEKRLNMILEIEKDLESQIKEKYEGQSFKFDRIKKVITFEIDFEEITL